MKKFLLSTFIVAVIAVVLAAPYWFGIEAERIFRHQMLALDDNNKVSVLSSDFKRGWYSSQAETAISIEGRGVTLSASHDIEHGPIPIKGFFDHLLGLRPLQALIRSVIYLPGTTSGDDGIEIGKATTWVKLNGKTNTTFDIPAAQVTVSNGDRFKWQEIKGHIDFDPVATAWEGDVKAGGFAWERDAMQFQLGAMTLEFISFPGSTGLALGSSTLSAQSMSLKSSSNSRPLSTTDLFVTSDATEQDARVAYSIDGTLGPSVLNTLDVNAGAWRLGARDLDLSALTELNTSPVGSALPINKVMDLVSVRGASIESGLELQTKSGPVHAKLAMRMDAGKIANPLLLLGALHGQAELEVPANVVELAAASAIRSAQSDTPQGVTEKLEPNAREQEIQPALIRKKIDEWTAGNVLVRIQDRYRFQASINGGSITVNGKPFNVLSLIR